VRRLDFNQQKAFKRIDACYDDLAEYFIDRPSSSPHEFWGNAEKLIRQDKAFFRHDALVFSKNRAIEEGFF